MTTEWSNERVLEFLHYYELEPIIWNPKHPYHKKKNMVQEAWQRIVETLSWDTNVQEAKKKKDSLMAYYRIHLNKLKSQTDERYSTNWFAFDTLHGFLAGNYDCNGTLNSQEMNEDTLPLDCVLTSGEESDSDCTRSRQKRKQNIMSDNILSSNKKQMSIKETTKSSNSLTEVDLYGRLLTEKLKKIDEENRLVLMNKIDNLVFETQLTLLKSSKSSNSSFTLQEVGINFPEDNTPQDNDHNAQHTANKVRIITQNMLAKALVKTEDK